MNTKKRNLLKDKRGVSPAIASLVLIVIAVVAAAGVGVITNSITGETGEQADKGSGLEMDIQGSTTVLPFGLAAATEYMDKNPMSKISVSGGGSGHGRNMAIVNKVDIGAASSKMKDEQQKYIIGQSNGVDECVHEVVIGKRMIVVIVNDGNATTAYEYNITSNTSTAGNIKFSDLKALYKDGTAITTPVSITTAFQRDDVSGTEEGFAAWLDLKDANKQLDSSAEARQGNPGVWAAVTDTDNSIGFVDLGYVSDTKYAAAMNETGIAPTADNYNAYKAASKDVGSKELTSMLYFYVHKDAMVKNVVSSYIDFCLSTEIDEGQDILDDVGMIPL